MAFFDGNNFGPTYTGVTRDEVRILIYDFGHGGQYSNIYIDLLAPPPATEDANFNQRVAQLATWQKYFNDRFQTYGRFVHFFAYFSDPCCVNSSPEKRRADAADNFMKVKPFAVLSKYVMGETTYLSEMAQKGVLSFGGRILRPSSFYSAHPKLIWSFPPTLDYYAGLYSSYVCRKVVPHNVSFSGNTLDAENPRRLGLLHSTDPTLPELDPLARLVKHEIERCGGKFVDDQTYSTDFCVPGMTCNDRENASAMASFKQNGVTTVIWPGGINIGMSHAAAAIQYRPEWVWLGFANADSLGYSKLHEKSVWRHAWLITSATQILRVAETPCWLAFKDTDPNASDSDTLEACNSIRGIYNDLRQLFIGIQLAGPRLHPDLIDRGFRAIPRVASSDPKVPACFYPAGDYSCIKDGTAEWWDPSGDPSSTLGPGCWRMAQDGRRYLSGQWPSGDVLAQKNLSNVCNYY